VSTEVQARTLAFVAGVGASLGLFWLNDAGTVTPRGHVILPAKVQYAWPDRRTGRLYVVTSDSAGRGSPGRTHHLTVCRVDPQAGTIQIEHNPIVLPDRPIHVSLGPQTAYVLIAFSDPSRVRVYKIQEDGSVGPEVEQDEPVPPGPYTHQVRVLPGGRQVAAVSLGRGASGSDPETLGAVTTYDFDAGRLTRPQVLVPSRAEGFGPRHLDIHPAGAWIYVAVERQNEIMVFDYDGESLGTGPRYVASTLVAPAPPLGRQTCGAIHVHPNGRFVYVSNRWSPEPGTAAENGPQGQNTLAVFSIDPGTGKLQLIQSVDTGGIHCRVFEISPDGETLIAGHVEAWHADSSREGSRPLVSVFRIGQDGQLTRWHAQEIGSSGESVFWLGAVSAARR
jgi:6-phosphogluconolactonase (cycloisomerase 2 family)